MIFIYVRVEKDLKVMALKLNPGNILLQVKLLHYFYVSILPHIKWIFLIYKIKANPLS